MNPKNELTVPKWPFFVADGIFVAAAAAAFWLTPEPQGPGLGAVVSLLLVIAAMVAMAPYLLEFYWNWQFAQAEQDERNETLRQALVKTGQEISEAARRWEEIHQTVASDAAAELKRQFEEAARNLQQWQVRLEEKEGKLAGRIETLFREEQKMRQSDRQEFEQLFAKLEVLRHELAPSMKPVGNGGGQAPEAVVIFNNDREADELAPAAVEEEPPAEPAKPEDELEENSAAEKTAVAPRVRKPKKPRLQEAEEGALFSTTTLVATAFIGASNKLFVRGEGPGLSWEQGVPMRFVEIGKWSWSTTDADGPVRFQVFKNDEEADKAGILTLEPGQRLDIRPEFEG